MGNQGSFMEKVYVYLPVLMCHSKMDYSDKGTMWNIRTAYFAEQASTKGKHKGQAHLLCRLQQAVGTTAVTATAAVVSYIPVTNNG